MAAAVGHGVDALPLCLGVDGHLHGDDLLALLAQGAVVRVAGRGVAALHLGAPGEQRGLRPAPGGPLLLLPRLVGLLHPHRLEDLLHEGPAVKDQGREGNAPGQLLDVARELHGLELGDFGQLEGFGRGDDGDALGDLESLLQLLGPLRAEELVDGLLCLAEVAAHHAQAGDVQNEGDGKGNQAHDHVVDAHVPRGEGDPQGDCVVRGLVRINAGTRVPAPVGKADLCDVEGVIGDPPPVTCTGVRNKQSSGNKNPRVNMNRSQNLAVSSPFLA